MKLKLTDNLFLKILSVILAVALWVVVLNISDAESTRSFTKEVNLINTDIITDNGKVFRVKEGTNQVRVTVRARQSVLREFNESDVILTADMRKNLKYDSQVEITVECRNKNIVVDDNITLSRRNVEVSIEDSATEQFQVHVKQEGKENNGLMVGSMVPEQTIIKITGPVSIVERISYVEAQVDVTGITATAVRNCELKLYDSAGSEIDNTYLNYIGKNNGIDVTITMLNTKSVSLSFSYSGTPAENYVVKKLTYKPEIVEIAGSAGVLSGITRLEIPEEAINVDGIDSELQLVVDLTEYLPTGVIIKQENESSALVIVEVEYVEPEEEEETSEPSDTAGEDTKKPSDTTGDGTQKPSDTAGGGTQKPSDSAGGGTNKPSDTTGGGTQKPSDSGTGDNSTDGNASKENLTQTGTGNH